MFHSLLSFWVKIIKTSLSSTSTGLLDSAFHGTDIDNLPMWLYCSKKMNFNYKKGELVTYFNFYRQFKIVDDWAFEGNVLNYYVTGPYPHFKVFTVYTLD